MKIERFRKFNTRDVYAGQALDNDVCMIAKAGNRIFMRGQTGLDLDQNMVGAEDVVLQTDQAMQNVKTLLEEAGSSLEHICRVTTYITDRAYRVPVYSTVAKYLKDIATVGTGLVVKGLAKPEMKVELDIDAVIPSSGVHQKFRHFNTENWFNQTGVTRNSCMVIRTDDEIYLRGQTGATLDGSRNAGAGQRPEDAAAQADLAMQNARILLDEAGASFDDIGKLRVYIGDRAYREPVYQVLGQHLGDTYPCSTGLIMRGFARPEILFEIDMAITLAKGTPHRRLRKFDTDSEYRDGQKLGSRFCKAVIAGDRVYLRGQTGTSLDGESFAHGDAGAQADQAMRNITALLDEAGSGLDDVCKVTIYIADRAYRDAVYQAVGKHLKGVFPVSTGLIVDGFASPNILVEIDIDAVIQS